MSSPLTPRAGAAGQPKQMSSRLLTMKFMQRAANTNVNASSQSPASEPAFKRRKTDHTPDSSAPSTPASDNKIYVSRSDVRAALQEESARERVAADRRAELGYGQNVYETKWVLEVNVPAQDNVHGVPPGEQSSESESEAEWAGNGRQTYGAYRRKNKSSGTTRSSAANTKTVDLVSDDDDDDDTAADSDEDSDMSDQSDYGRPAASQPRKRTATAMDLTDEEAMAALDRADLTKSRYAKARAAVAPLGRAFQLGGNRREKRGDKHPKKKGKKNRKR